MGAPHASVSPASPIPSPRSKNLEAPPSAPVSGPSVLADEWRRLASEVKDCRRCKLHATRTQTVFGTGNLKARLMFVGEGPGAEEDRAGEPFVGRAGQLLTRMIEAMGLQRSDVYIANVVKSRPPENRNPEPDEIEACLPYLLKQIELVDPTIVVALGTFAAQTLLATDQGLDALRGRLHAYPRTSRRDGSEIRVMPTYHPAFLLRNPEMKKPVWDDLQLVMGELRA
jgi:uracil-DNA glycosylase family 4